MHLKIYFQQNEIKLHLENHPCQLLFLIELKMPKIFYRTYSISIRMATSPYLISYVDYRGLIFKNMIDKKYIEIFCKRLAFEFLTKQGRSEERREGKRGVVGY